MALNTYSFPGAVYPTGFDANPALQDVLVLAGRTVVPGAANQTANTQLVQMSNGLYARFNGVGLTYDQAGNLAGGFLTSIQILKLDGLNGLVEIQRLNTFESAEQFGIRSTGSAFDLAGWLLRGNDTLNGSAGNDVLYGRDGNDVLNGGAGDDQLVGGRGDDTYNGGAGWDHLSYDDGTAQHGVTINVTNILGDGFATDGDNPVFGNFETFTSIQGFTGTNFRDIMLGGAGGEEFIGLDGNDFIDGNGGVDGVNYSQGATHGANINLTTGIATDGQNGIDTLADIEDVTGTAFADIIVGNNGNNYINGLAGDDNIDTSGGNDEVDAGDGNDRIETGGGVDVVRGGNGNDTYLVHNTLTTVDERLSTGTDTVIADVEYDLEDDDVLGDVENLTIVGNARRAFGNDLANIIVGNANENLLVGRGGNDTISGGLRDDDLRGDGGNDTLNGDEGDDTLAGGLGNDVLRGGVGDDRLEGGAGNDVLDGGAGSDVLRGGLGNDTYLLGAESSVGVIDSGGVDTVVSSVSRSLVGLGTNTNDFIENLTLTGVANINGTGNNANNVIRGNAGNNVLSGLGGNDTLLGGAGNDTLNGGNGADVIRGDAGNDVANGGNGNDNIGGGLGNDVLRGDAGNDVISGDAGNDYLVGGAGVDVLTGGLGNDRFLFNSKVGADSVRDFSHVSDTFLIDNAVFTGVANGALSAAAFYVGTAAHDASDRVIYDKTSGNIWFDSDGTGSAAKVLVADLANSPSNIAANDFFVV